MSKKNQKRKRYSADFKTEAVRLMDQRGNRTVAEVAESLGIAESLLTLGSASTIRIRATIAERHRKTNYDGRGARLPT